jgi:hypothetical protein
MASFSTSAWDWLGADPPGDRLLGLPWRLVEPAVLPAVPAWVVERDALAGVRPAFGDPMPGAW